MTINVLFYVQACLEGATTSLDVWKLCVRHLRTIIILILKNIEYDRYYKED